MDALTRIRLTEEEIAAARACAKKRLSDAISSNAKDRFGSNSEDSHFWGALGEIAVARHIDTAWKCTSRTWAARDVGRYEVRSIPPGTRPYIKAKPNDPEKRAIAVVVFRSESLAEIHGWITAKEVRESGTLEDPGGRSAPAHFLRDMRRLNPVFPEVRMPWDTPSTAGAAVPGTMGRDFPLVRREDGSVEVSWSTCPDCGERYASSSDHVSSYQHRTWSQKAQTIEGQTTIPVPPQPDIYKYTERPKSVAFGAATICPRCKGIRRKRKGIVDDLCMEVGSSTQVCIRCNGFGIVPNVGPVAAAKPE